MLYYDHGMCLMMLMTVVRVGCCDAAHRMTIMAMSGLNLTAAGLPRQTIGEDTLSSRALCCLPVFIPLSSSRVPARPLIRKTNTCAACTPGFLQLTTCQPVYSGRDKPSRKSGERSVDKQPHAGQTSVKRGSWRGREMALSADGRISCPFWMSLSARLSPA